MADPIAPPPGPAPAPPGPPPGPPPGDNPPPGGPPPAGPPPAGGPPPFDFSSIAKSFQGLLGGLGGGGGTGGSGGGGGGLGGILQSILGAFTGGSSSKGGGGAGKGADLLGGVLGDLLGLASPGGVKEVAADEAAAQRMAQQLVSKVDKDKDKVLIDFEGTFSHKVNPAIAEGAGGDVATVNMDYPADLNMSQNVANGKRAFEIAAKQLKNQGKSVSLTGYSQGAMIGAEIMGDRSLRQLVDRAILIGLPSAANYQFDSGKDPKTVEITNANDVVGGQNQDVITNFFKPGSQQAHGQYDFRALIAQYLRWNS